MAEIESERQLDCPLCGTSGDVLYSDLRDRLFGAPGVWGMRICPSCEALWLDPRPTPRSIGKAYETYYTHGSQSGLAGLYNAAVRQIARERAASAYGFGRGTPFLSQM